MLPICNDSREKHIVVPSLKVLTLEFRKVTEKMMRPGHWKKQLHCTSVRISCFNLT